jgi:hypothetical protein
MAYSDKRSGLSSYNRNSAEQKKFEEEANKSAADDMSGVPIAKKRSLEKLPKLDRFESSLFEKIRILFKSGKTFTMDDIDTKEERKLLPQLIKKGYVNACGTDEWVTKEDGTKKPAFRLAF